MANYLKLVFIASVLVNLPIQFEIILFFVFLLELNSNFVALNINTQCIGLIHCNKLKDYTYCELHFERENELSKKLEKYIYGAAKYS